MSSKPSEKKFWRAFRFGQVAASRGSWERDDGECDVFLVDMIEEFATKYVDDRSSP